MIWNSHILFFHKQLKYYNPLQNYINRPSQLLIGTHRHREQEKKTEDTVSNIKSESYIYRAGIRSCHPSNGCSALMCEKCV